MSFSEELPAENTNPWYAPITAAWSALTTFVNGLETSLAGKANTADLGTAATADSTDFATAAQGATADTATQPADLTAGLATKADLAHTHDAGDVVSGVLAAARIPSLAISKTTGLQAALDAKADSADIVVLGVLDDGETPPAPGVYLRRPAP